jgi:hypothetical protein
MNSCFQQDSTEFLMPYSRLTWAALFCSVSISNTTRALNSRENLRRCVILDPFPGVNSYLAYCPVFGVHYKPVSKLVEKGRNTLLILPLLPCEQYDFFRHSLPPVLK